MPIVFGLTHVALLRRRRSVSLERLVPSPCCSWWTSRVGPAPASSRTCSPCLRWDLLHCPWHGGLDPQGGGGRRMAVVGFAVLFAGIESPQAATASTAALLLFVLPVAVAQPPGEVGPRLIGWGFAAAFCIAACMLVWPTPWHDDLRRRLSATISAVGRARRRPSLKVSPTSKPRERWSLSSSCCGNSLPGPRTHPWRSGQRCRSG